MTVRAFARIETDSTKYSVCTACYVLLEYATEDVVRSVGNNDNSELEVIHTIGCPVCNETIKVKQPSASEFIRNSAGRIR